MKTLFSRLSGALMMGMVVAASFTSCTKDDTSASVGITYSLSSNASGSQAVPASSNSNGSGNFTGTYSSTTHVMTYTATWANLTSAPLAGGLYTGASGTAGSSLTIWTLGSGLSTSGTFSGSTTLNADQEAQLLSGKMYFIFTTAANASGEIRGQISASAQQ